MAHSIVDASRPVVILELDLSARAGPWPHIRLRNRGARARIVVVFDVARPRDRVETVHGAFHTAPRRQVVRRLDAFATRGCRAAAPRPEADRNLPADRDEMEPVEGPA